MMHYEMPSYEHMLVSEAKRNGAHFDRPEMLCRTGDGHARGSRVRSTVTCVHCLTRLERKA